jgi:GT2 family glycosyltransferase
VNPAQVTIIILSWNLRDDTLACLESLASADLRGASILVVDNGSRDGSVEAIRARFPALEVLALPENRGYAGGNNAGIRLALERGAEGVLLLNNDTRVAPDFLLPLVSALEDSPWAAAVSSAILRLDRPEMLDVAYSEVRFDRRHVVRIVGVNAMMGHGFDRRQEVQVAIGCSLLIRADALRTVGLFDEEFFAYHEEVDWCLRAHRWGYRILFEPYSRVYHGGSRSTRRLRPAPPAALESGEPELPNAEPPPWNPVRAYLGARNIVRLLRAHATPDEKREFLRACRRELPREFLAVVWGREGWMTLGRWEWADIARYCFVERHPSVPHARGRLSRALALAAVVPFEVVFGIPRDIWRAYRQGRLAQFAAYLGGLRDGYLRRPIPFARLGLR